MTETPRDRGQSDAARSQGGRKPPEAEEAGRTPHHGVRQRGAASRGLGLPASGTGPQEAFLLFRAPTPVRGASLEWRVREPPSCWRVRLQVASARGPRDSHLVAAGPGSCTTSLHLVTISHTRTRAGGPSDQQHPPCGRRQRPPWGAAEPWRLWAERLLEGGRAFSAGLPGGRGSAAHPTQQHGCDSWRFQAQVWWMLWGPGTPSPQPLPRGS